jgi:hypothetical protein
MKSLIFILTSRGMVSKKRATKKRQTKTSKKGTTLTIPQLRKAFEHVETFVELHHKKPHAQLVKEFQQEWRRTFKKEIEKKEAEAYINHQVEEIRHKHPKDRKHSGGAQVISGAPICQDTRPGVYISPGVNQGSYAHVPAYVDKGFCNPEIGRQYDPVPGQTHYPSATPYGLGSNQAGGTRRKRKGRGKQEGGALTDAVNQFFTRPIFSYNPPPAFLDNITSSMMAKELPQSPDPSQTRLPYQSNLTGFGGVLPVTTSVTPIPPGYRAGPGWF